METSDSFGQIHSEGTAHSKLLLFGEHAAVYGLPAVGLPLPSTLTVTVTAHHDVSSELSGWQCENIAHQYIPFIHELIREIGTLIPEFKKIKSGKIAVASDIIPAVGLGSSAALCVAFVKAVCGLFSNVKTYSERTWNWAHHCEHIFHGSPSGVDTGLSCLNRLCAFYPTQEGLPRVEIIANLRLYLLICVFKRNRNTGELVAHIKRRISDDIKIKEQIWKLGQIAQAAINHFKDNKNDLYDNIGNLATEAHARLSELGLSIPEQDDILESGLKKGVLGGKLSGAGGGGTFYLIARDYDHMMTLADTLRKNSENLSSDNSLLIQAVIWENEQSRFV